MTVYPQILPTITQILALEHLEHLDVEVEPERRLALEQSPGVPLMPSPSADSARSPASARRQPQAQPQTHTQAQTEAENQWAAAITTLNQLLKQYLQQAPVDVSSDGDQAVQGLILSSPVPVMATQSLAGQFANWVLRPEPLAHIQGLSLQLPPGDRHHISNWADSSWVELNTLPLIPQDLSLIHI